MTWTARTMTDPRIDLPAEEAPASDAGRLIDLDTPPETPSTDPGAALLALTSICAIYSPSRPVLPRKASENVTRARNMR